MTSPGAASLPTADGGALTAEVVGFWYASDVARFATFANPSVEGHHDANGQCYRRTYSLR